MTTSAPLADLSDSLTRRQTMVDCQVRTFDVTDQRLLARVMDIPRERFVPESMRDLAYSDVGLTVEPGASEMEARYLLPPFILARLIQGAGVKPTDKVLDVACGTGYSTAILAGLAGSVTALEGDRRVLSDLRARLVGFGLGHVETIDGDLFSGSARHAPFDVIVVNGAIDDRLDDLFAQLSEGGRLVTIKRSSDDPTGHAAKAVCFLKRGADIGIRVLFDASAPVLRAFGKAPAFVF